MPTSTRTTHNTARSDERPLPRLTTKLSSGAGPGHAGGQLRHLAGGDEALRLGQGGDGHPAARHRAVVHPVRQPRRRPAEAAAVTAGGPRGRDRACGYGLRASGSGPVAWLSVRKTARGTSTPGTKRRPGQRAGSSEARKTRKGLPAAALARRPRVRILTRAVSSNHRGVPPGLVVPPWRPVTTGPEGAPPARGATCLPGDLGEPLSEEANHDSRARGRPPAPRRHPRQAGRGRRRLADTASPRRD